MNKTILFFIIAVLTLNVVSADLTISVPTNVVSNSNFDILIVGSSLYAAELKIPNGFVVVSDQSNGVIGSDGIYRTIYGTILKITLRAPEWTDVNNGVFQLTGNYTEGAGIKSFADSRIEVSADNTQISCPSCPADTPWSACKSNLQSKTSYICNAETNYVCQGNIQTKSCTVESLCSVGWVCTNDKLGLRNNDCSFSTIVDCKNGCNVNSNSCNPDASGNLLTGAVTGVSEGKGRLWLTEFFTGIINFLKGLFGMI